MKAFQRGSRRQLISEINVVPFIDVMLVLLIIFMVTTPLLTQGVKVDLPKTSAKAIPEQKKEPLIITVDVSGNYYLNSADQPNKPITAQTLTYLLSNELIKDQRGDPRPVLVRADKNVNYGKVMEAMVLLQQAGANGVGLITEPITANTIADKT